MRPSAWNTLVLSLILAMSSAVPSAHGTVQERDRVRYEGEERVLMECPLSPLLSRLPDLPRFDQQRSSNWKGYTARWEIKDARLVLVTFEATSGGKPVPVGKVLPGKELPVVADWFTGRIRIPIGEPTKEGWHGYYGATFERVIVMEVERGKVVRSRELNDARIKSPSEEWDEAKAKKDAVKLGPKK